MSEPKWLTLARAELGTTEKDGPLSDPRVMAFFKEAGAKWVKDDSTTAWCAAFVTAILKRAGLPALSPDKALGARNYEQWGQRLDIPHLGCVGVKRRNGGEKWQGHVGFVVAANQTTIWMLGGNQSNQVSIAPFSRWQFTAFRWPEGVPPTDARLPAQAPGKAGSEA